MKKFSKSFHCIASIAMVSAGIVACSKNEHVTYTDLSRSDNFKSKPLEVYNLRGFKIDELASLKSVPKRLKSLLSPRGDSVYYYSLQNISGNKIEFTTVDVYEEFGEVYLTYRIVDSNLSQKSSFIVAATGGEGGASVSGSSFHISPSIINYCESYSDESEGVDSMCVKYSIMKDGAAAIDTLMKTHKNIAKSVPK